MKEIISLINILSKQKIRQINILTEDTGDSKMNALYQGIENGIIKNDEDALRYVYDDVKNQSNLKKLKERFLKRLYNTLFFIDINKYVSTDQSKILHVVCKNYSLIKILLERNAKNPAIALAKRTLRLCLKYDLCDYGYLISKILRRHYAYIQPQKKEYQKYLAITQKARIEVQAEYEIDELYDDISSLYSQNASPDLILSKLEVPLPRINNLLSTIQSFSFNYRAYELLSYYYRLTEKYDKVIETCEDALKFFKNKPYINHFALTAFNNDLTVTSINLGKYEKASQSIDTVLELVDPGTFNWYKPKKYAFFLASLQKQWNQAYQIVAETTLQKSFKQFNLLHQSWLIKEAYVHFLVKLEKISPSLLEETPLRPFKVGRFLNEVPDFSKDKRGLNITILIAHVLILLVNRKYGQIIDRLDALNMYCHRYLRNDETLRSNCFIKMLVRLADADYHPVRAERYVKKYKDKLLSSPLEVTEQSMEIEVIPYETLWELVVELLEKKK